MASLGGEGATRGRFVVLAVAAASLVVLFAAIMRFPDAYSYACREDYRCWRFDTLPLLLVAIAGGLSAVLAVLQPWPRGPHPLIRAAMAAAAFLVGWWIAATCLPDLAFNGP